MSEWICPTLKSKRRNLPVSVLFKSLGRLLTEPAIEAVLTLRAHKLRSSLALLGVGMAVSVLTFVVSVISGTTRYIQDRVANLGPDVFLITRLPIITNQQDLLRAMRRNRNLTWEDFVTLKEHMQLAFSIGVEAQTEGRARTGGKTIGGISIRGVTANIAGMDVEQVSRGRYVTDEDNQRRADVAFIGREIANRLFPTTEPVGRMLNLAGHSFEIVGVAKPLGSVFGESQDFYAYIPIRTFFKLFGEHGDSFSINIKALGPELVDEAESEARGIMRRRRHLDVGEDDNFGILSSRSIMDLWRDLTAVIALAMLAIASVFLLISGVVIMNVMLTSVSERTREIGVRKSLGARRRDILLQFLVESALLSQVGGAVGIGASYLLSLVTTLTTPVPSHVPISAVVFALCMSTAVGVFFGVYPAHQASKLDPIEALRFEA
jgi:putative ABC transport system permease protein